MIPKQDIKIFDIQAKGISYISKYRLIDVFLSVGNIDIWYFPIELLTSFKQMNEKKVNFIVAEIINLIITFTKTEYKSNRNFKEIIKFVKD